MDSGLVDAARASIEVLLDLDGTDIVLVQGKGTRTEQPGGGYTYSVGAVRPVQRFSIADRTRAGSSRRTGDSGVVVLNRDLALVGRHDAVAEEGDYWIDGGTRYRIDELVVSNEYKREWKVTAVGPEGTNG